MSEMVSAGSDTCGRGGAELGVSEGSCRTCGEMCREPRGHSPDLSSRFSTDSRQGEGWPEPGGKAGLSQGAGAEGLEQSGAGEPRGTQARRFSASAKLWGHPELLNSTSPTSLHSNLFFLC